MSTEMVVLIAVAGAACLVAAVMIVLWRVQTGRAAEAQSEIEKLTAAHDELEADLRAQTERRVAAETEAARVPHLEAELDARQLKVESLREELSARTTQLNEERKAAAEKFALLQEAEQQLKNAFTALSAEALRKNNESFLQLATQSLQKFQQGAQSDLEKRQQAIDELVKPLKESLTNVDSKLVALDKARAASQSSLTEQLQQLGRQQGELREQTSKLVNALRTPVVRGRWGEIQLRRVVEMAGMVNYCDFVEQESVETDGGRLRPDMIVKLPGGKQVIIDAKVPLEGYLQAIEAPDEETRQAHLQAHARQTREHMKKLGQKSYQDQFESTPEFVVMFLPGESFFNAALEQDPQLIEEGVKNKVIPASPTTLIALLRAVSYGWQQERIARSAREVSELGKELYARIVTFTDHFAKVGNGLTNALNNYNAAVGSLESRVLVSARRFKELGVPGTGDDLIVPQVDAQARRLAIAEGEQQPAADPEPDNETEQ
ncbi:MAG: DNA recombination protein RmuC [Candidatus Lernaella stagnicola]|nr:DNA recombination protein RmuC [Candidatus Lernaella stagnicola]